ncbi:unnamed protein product [Closterium sp. NIES-54]
MPNDFLQAMPFPLTLEIPERLQKPHGEDPLWNWIRRERRRERVREGERESEGEREWEKEREKEREREKETASARESVMRRK